MRYLSGIGVGGPPNSFLSLALQEVTTDKPAYQKFMLEKRTLSNAMSYPLEGGTRQAVLTEPASSYANCLKTRGLSPVGCTLC